MIEILLYFYQEFFSIFMFNCFLYLDEQFKYTDYMNH